ncbi:MAG: hypothetical protein GY804_00705 [Alphaproteobacteria bacterium]|nr:hypothetical protein [Alphaproteobacteria bacterium]
MKYIKPFNATEENAPYVNANPAEAIPGSIPPAEVFEHIQREILSVITDAGLTPDAEDLTQLNQAIATAAANGLTQDIIAAKGLAKTDLSNVEQSAIEAAFSFSAKGFFNGFTTSNSAGDAANDIEIKAGVCRDANDTCFMKSVAPMTKRIDANWAVGNNSGGRPASVPLTALTWYHIFAIMNPTTGAVDFGFDTNINASNLLASAASSGFTKHRYINSVRTDADGNIIPFLQTSNTIRWNNGTSLWFIGVFTDLDVTHLTATERLDLTLSVPVGLRVSPILRVILENSSPWEIFLLEKNSNASSGVSVNAKSQHLDINFSGFYTDTAAKLSYISTAWDFTRFYVGTRGWVIDRNLI